ncbi:MAG TPA: AbrB/MazE/SpoVT family DNA-binding domain-containing protein [Caulobacteraceae bacterium]|nr:AbrB/MazE/SpoVT family DNA-binding domain-containing protein [Caulobacteraceae bacterium]
MRVRIAKWGNSLGLRIPRALAEEVGLEEGGRADLKAQGGRLVVRAVPAFSLQDVLRNMTPQAAHAAFDWGEDAGRERVDE